MNFKLEEGKQPGTKWEETVCVQAEHVMKLKITPSDTFESSSSNGRSFHGGIWQENCMDM